MKNNLLNYILYKALLNNYDYCYYHNWHVEVQESKIQADYYHFPRVVKVVGWFISNLMFSHLKYSLLFMNLRTVIKNSDIFSLFIILPRYNILDFILSMYK